ncbi:MAG: glycosyltransferase family A protein, partial [Actinomycetota bacterium]|nr:glycosyltransferase family A protein [Actinomycetota bacterium]
MPAPGSPSVSILTPAYNAERTIAAAIASAQAQERSDWELVIVDDGSTDGTADAARRAAAGDARIKIVSQPNAGCGFARNTAAANASADLFCLLDADDEYLPQYLTRMLALTERYPDRDLYSCNGYFVFPNGTRVPVRKGPEWNHER